MRLFIGVIYSLFMSVLLFSLVESVYPKSLWSILGTFTFILMFVSTTQLRIHNYDMRFDLEGKFWKYL